MHTCTCIPHCRVVHLPSWARPRCCHAPPSVPDILGHGNVGTYGGVHGMGWACLCVATSTYPHGVPLPTVLLGCQWVCTSRGRQVHALLPALCLHVVASATSQTSAPPVVAPCPRATGRGRVGYMCREHICAGQSTLQPTHSSQHNG